MLRTVSSFGFRASTGVSFRRNDGPKLLALSLRADNSSLSGGNSLCLAEILSVFDFNRTQSCCPQAGYDSKLA